MRKLYLIALAFNNIAHLALERTSTTWAIFGFMFGHGRVTIES